MRDSVFALHPSYKLDHSIRFDTRFLGPYISHLTVFSDVHARGFALMALMSDRLSAEFTLLRRFPL